MNSPLFWALDPLLRAHAKIFIADVHRLSHIPGFAEQFPDLYQYDARIISNVEITGTVVGIEHLRHMIIYTVDDGFGAITCCHWTTKFMIAPEFELGDCVRVLGRVNEYNNKKQINVHNIYRVEDYNMEVFNWLQTVRLRETVYSKPFEIPTEILDHKDEIETLLTSTDQDSLLDNEDSQASDLAGMDITDEESLQNAIYRYLLDTAIDSKVNYGTFMKSAPVREMTRHYLSNTIPPAQIDLAKVRNTIRLSFDALCHEGLLYVVDEEHDIYQVVRLDGLLRELIVKIVQEAGADHDDIHHGGITRVYIAAKVKEDKRFENMHWSKIFQALQLLVLDSIVYQVSPQEYKITR